MTARAAPARGALEPFGPGGPEASTDPVVPAGFRMGAAAMGIKSSGSTDVGVVAISKDLPDAAVGAVYTTNLVVAAPILLSRRHLTTTAALGNGRYGWTRAVICTAGCANAATGEPGMRDQERLARGLARGLRTTPERTLALSTGLIGTRIPADRVAPQVARLARKDLSDGPEALEAVAEAMRTTDSRRKVASVRLELPGTSGAVAVTVTGIAKGVGMIHPRMATMLSVILTDAAASPRILHGIIRRVSARTWGQLTVDGDTSTNDTVFLLASGASGSLPVEPSSAALSALEQAVGSVARSLARQQAADGEGATTLICCQVTGAANDVDARAVARSVVASSLVKAAIHGRDPNWGRIAAAAGNARLADAALLEAAGLDAHEARQRSGAPVSLDPARLRIAIGGTEVFAGIPLRFDRERLRSGMDTSEIVLRVDLGLGSGRGEAFGCDLTERYVVENSEYST